MRKQNLFILLSWLSLTTATAQRIKPVTQKPLPVTNHTDSKKYPSLLWQITGNGMKKPSYLFGTMHVSDKLAFHLGDSFYTAIKNVEVVALETNPENWQDDFSKSVFYKTPEGVEPGQFTRINRNGANDMLRISSFAIDNYEEQMKASLAVEPSLINGMLYRTYGTRTDDFEEDTYLDMYIFQTGKKLGKRLTGVENFEESEKLVMEAYKDMMKDRNRKRKSYDFEDMYTNPKKVEDAYRKGDLDVLDSLEALNVESDAFQEKFLYRRNEIQANSIDSIIKKLPLFVGVGAAHLPGKRGVIELLRKKGYILRPVIMDERSRVEKEMIDKTRYPANFLSQTSDDGFYQVSIPGKKFYRFTDWRGMDVVQFADMVNGAYYMVTRIKTNSLQWGHSPEYIHKKIDSLLYENIPGKISKKTAISKNGYKGWEIFSRTRRGDNQRYNIYITPFEIIVFKMSGNGEYINGGEEANKFFGSVRMKEYNETGWSNYQPPTGGFSVQLPHTPSLLKDANYRSDRLEYAAVDKEGNSYLVMKTNQHNFSFAEEDTFQLNLMGESYAFSPFISKELSHQFSKVNGYPALDCRYQHKDGSLSTVKYVIRGPLFYAVIAHSKSDNANVARFLSSFSITPFIYPEVKPRSDTTLYYTVKSPLPLTNKEKEDDLKNMLDLVRMYQYDNDDEDDELGGYSWNRSSFKWRFVGNDTIGEKIMVTYNAPGKYTYYKDTADLWKKGSRWSEMDEDSTFIFRSDKKYQLPDGGWCREIQLTDTGSSRLILSKWIYRDGHLFSLTALTDTLSPGSVFLDQFFTTFAPADTLKKQSLFTKKTELFFNDYFSTDSARVKKARKEFHSIVFDSTDVPLLKKAIEQVSWNTKDYLEVKKHFISELADLKDSTITPFLKDLYWKVKDSSELQNLILNSLLKQETKASFAAFRDLVTQEPPLASDGSFNYRNRNRYFGIARSFISYSPGWRVSFDDEEDPRFRGKWAKLYDSLSLTKTIFPDILQLVNIDDYKETILNLLAVMVDSGFLKATDYEQHFSKLYLDGKQLLKKQIAKEEENNIEKASRKDKPKRYYEDEEEEEVMEEGNDDLEQYAVLLMPFYEKNPGVTAFFDQLMKTKDRQLLYNAFILLLRNNKTVPDSLFGYFAKQDKYRITLYDDLKKMKKLDKFPADWKSQQQIARSLFMGSGYEYEKPDSVVFLDKLPVTYKGKKGWVYFFKYRRMRDDTYWQLASVGMQPEKPDEIDTDNSDFTEKEDRKLENDKPITQQLQKMLKELLYAKRSSAEEFYSGQSYNFYKNYLSEMVKRQRYRD